MLPALSVAYKSVPPALPSDAATLPMPPGAAFNFPPFLEKR